MTCTHISMKSNLTRTTRFEYLFNFYQLQYVGYPFEPEEIVELLSWGLLSTTKNSKEFQRWERSRRDRKVARSWSSDLLIILGVMRLDIMVSEANSPIISSILLFKCAPILSNILLPENCSLDAYSSRAIPLFLRIVGSSFPNRNKDRLIT